MIHHYKPYDREMCGSEWKEKHDIYDSYWSCEKWRYGANRARIVLNDPVVTIEGTEKTACPDCLTLVLNFGDVIYHYTNVMDESDAFEAASEALGHILFNHSCGESAIVETMEGRDVYRTKLENILEIIRYMHAANIVDDYDLITAMSDAADIYHYYWQD